MTGTVPALSIAFMIITCMISFGVPIVIRGNIWLYALYGGLMAGLFEETGRYLAFSFALKKYRAKNVNALMYGAGHGGFEAIVIVGLTMINNIVWSFND